MASRLPVVRERISGAWITDFALEEGSLSAVLTLNRDGTFSFRWRNVSGWRAWLSLLQHQGLDGEWDVSEPIDETSVLALNVKRFKSAVLTAVDAAYLLNPAGPLVLLFRSSMVGVNRGIRHRIGGKMYSRRYRVVFTSNDEIHLSSPNGDGEADPSVWRRF